MTPITFNTLIQHSLYGWLMVVLIACSVTDLYHRRIPNLMTLTTILIALLSYCLISGMNGFLFSLRGLGLGFIIFLLPYIMGGMGAGDVKLMGTVGAVLGTGHTLVALLFIAISGGVLALGQMLYRRTFKQTLTGMFSSFLLLVLHRDTSVLKVDKDKLTQEGIPFGIAITSGTLLYFFYLLITGKTSTLFAVL